MTEIQKRVLLMAHRVGNAGFNYYEACDVGGRGITLHKLTEIGHLEKFDGKWFITTQGSAVLEASIP